MNIDLTGKTAIVCGASKGIGRAAAMELAALGATITVIARNAEMLEQVRASLPTPKYQNHQSLAVDFSDINLVHIKIANFIKAGNKAHILLNNSGGPPAGPVHTATPEQFIAVFNQHLIGSHVMTQALLPVMKEEKYGRIINVVSTSVKQPIKGLGVSNTIRGAVASWAKTLAGEVGGWGITVNNILPGATDTDRMAEIVEGKSQKFGKPVADIIAEEISHIPAGRFGSPEELAQAIGFLASPAAAYINGINLPVDGGRTGCL
ncbi:MAG TPA: SDR family oxidoreductase [Micavibrio sp.]|jgi:3-oxoacyl-[acyl-carrier protein] reductase